MLDQEQCDAATKPRLLITHREDERGKNQPDGTIDKARKCPPKRLGRKLERRICHLGRTERKTRHTRQSDANQTDRWTGKRLSNESENDRDEQREIVPGVRLQSGRRRQKGNPETSPDRNRGAPDTSHQSEAGVTLR